MLNWIIQYWVEWLFGLLTIGFGIVYKRLSKRIKIMKIENNGVRHGVKALLHNEIMKMGKNLMDQGYCTPEDFQEMKYLYDPYHFELDGNGTAERMMKQVEALPQTPPED